MSEASDIFLSGKLQAGTQLNGIYEIDQLIATGGMGEIYKGHEVQTGDPVAIKVIRADMADDPLVLALFRKEASALNRIHHEAIVRYHVFSLDPVLRRHYLAMEFVEGESLSHTLKRGPLAVEQVHALQKRLASGLQAAHDRQIIHRDVTPDNVIISDGDVARARIIDFGIARSNRVGDMTILDGGFAGKYSYVSPEQLGMFGGEVTGKSDIYSLGLVLAYCLLGEPIDMGQTQLAIVEKRKTVPDLSNVDWHMRRLLEHMLQPDPTRRPASMAEVAAWPLASPDERTVVVHPARPSWRREHAAPTPHQGQVHAADPLQTHNESGVDAALRGRSHLRLIASAAGLAASIALGVFLTHKPASRPPPPMALEEKGSSHEDLKLTRVEDFARLGQFLHQYDGGECFLALLDPLSTEVPKIEGYGLGPQPFEALDEAFRKANGLEAKIGVRKISVAQCPALAFAKPYLLSANQSGLLEIADRKLQIGSTLQGTIATTEPNVSLLVVDDQGLVYDLSSQLRPAPGGKGFALRIQGAAKQKPMTWLLLAIASPQQFDKPKSGSPLAGTDFFADLGRQVQALDQKPAIAIQSVSIE